MIKFRQKSPLHTFQITNLIEKKKLNLFRRVTRDEDTVICVGWMLKLVFKLSANFFCVLKCHYMS